VRLDRHIDPLSLLQEYRSPFSRVNRPGRGVGHAPTFSVEVEVRVDLYLNSHSVNTWDIAGRPSHLKEGVCVTDDGHT
jgi:hypothetical protein